MKPGTNKITITFDVHTTLDNNPKHSDDIVDITLDNNKLQVHINSALHNYDEEEGQCFEAQQFKRGLQAIVLDYVNKNNNEAAYTYIVVGDAIVE